MNHEIKRKCIALFVYDYYFNYLYINLIYAVNNQ